MRDKGERTRHALLRNTEEMWVMTEVEVKMSTRAVTKTRLSVMGKYEGVSWDVMHL